MWPCWCIGWFGTVCYCFLSGFYCVFQLYSSVFSISWYGYRYHVTWYIGQQHPITVYRTDFWVSAAQVLSVIRCSCYHFLDRILFSIFQFRAGKKATYFNDKWYIGMWQTGKTERKEKESTWYGELKICVKMWWADENHVSDTTTWRCQEHNRDRMVTSETHLKILYSCEMATKCNISWDCSSTLFGNIPTGFWVYFMWRWILLG